MNFLKCLLPQSAYHKAAEQLLKTIQENTEKARIEYRRFTNTHDLMTSTLNEAGSFIWRKDQAGRYLLANRAMCHSLLDRDSLDVLGKTDEEILAGYSGDDQNYSSFLETMSIADRQTLRTRKRSTFLELGKVHGYPPMLIHSVRTPVYDQDYQLHGIIGVGSVIADCCDDLHAMARTMFGTDKIIELHPNIIIVQ
ncbi:MAG: hypothetical protein VR64_07300 [Desulfatitalea sp. BRH_c12]|nr:MAG: hypothetical protein VR64_07300 [Desulfatitalea sp. BRH_c12]